MTYITPELRLVGAAHAFVLGSRTAKPGGDDQYEPEGDQFYADLDVELPW